MFRKEYLLAVGGYQVTSVVEDLDLVVRLHRHLRRHKIRYEIPFIPDPVAWTEVPESGRMLSRQRERWHRGLIAADRKSTRLNSSHGYISYAVFCLKKKKTTQCRVNQHREA